MKKILRLTAIVITGVSLASGVAAASTGTITGPTGPGSTNSVENRHTETRRANNTVDATVTNNNPQRARTGNATVELNTTTGGTAATGEAANDSLLRATVTTNNTNANDAALGTSAPTHTGTIGTTGPNSDNTVLNRSDYDARVTNDTTVDINNTNNQRARSGNATVSENTTGGGATSGAASNIGTTEVTVSTTN